ncbi:hypothetical protein K378_04065 [Streptomyces sp. Amel2xB2]|nr:hypothetical protein K378_04065 [Streptomyces sp. Amel2xB2]
MTALGQLVGSVLKSLMPILTPIIALVGKLASFLARVLAAQITIVTIPVLKILTSLLRGDFSGAWKQTKALVANVGNFLRSLFIKLGVWVAVGIAKAVAWIKTLPARARSALVTLAPILRRAAMLALARFTAAVITGAMKTLAWLRGLPARIAAALGNLGTLLVGKGRAVVTGLWAGIKSMGGWIESKITGWAKSMIPGPVAKALGIASPSRVMARDVGRWIPAGVAAGIRSGQGAVDGAMRRMVPVSGVPAMATPAVSGAPRAGAAAGVGGRSGPLVHIGTWNAGNSTPGPDRRRPQLAHERHGIDPMDRTTVDVATVAAGMVPGQLRYGELLLGTHTPYRWRKLTGWEELPEVDSGNVPRPAAHGAWAGRLLSQTRTVTLDEMIVRAPVALLGAVVETLNMGTALVEDDADGSHRRARHAAWTARALQQPDCRLLRHRIRRATLVARHGVQPRRQQVRSRSHLGRSLQRPRHTRFAGVCRTPPTGRPRHHRRHSALADRRTPRQH